MTSLNKLICLIVGVALIPLATAATLPDTLTLQYAVELGDMRLGTLTRTLTRKGDVYHVQSITRAEGLATVLVGDVTETCSFKVVNGKIQPLNYRIVQSGRKAYDRSVHIDTKNAVARYSSGGQTDLPKNYTVDQCSLPFAYLLGGPSAFDSKNMALIGGKKIRHYGPTESKKEKILLYQIGRVDTIMVKRNRLDSANRSLSFWLAPKFGHLPILIVEQRKLRSTVARLESIDASPDIMPAFANPQ